MTDDEYQFSDADWEDLQQAMKQGSLEKPVVNTVVKRVTGFNSVEEWRSYNQGRLDEEKTIIDWIKKWTGLSNSVLGEVLSQKFNELYGINTGQTGT